jgi:adenine-specific DNA-methyltransferase
MENINDYMPLSNDWNKERLETLKKMFPDLFSNEGKLNINELKKIVDPESVSETERYEFRWFGKSAAKRKAFSPSNATLIFEESKSINPNESENLIIEGENLEVLKLLSTAYREKIKCIYIDPPYNTGNDFVYRDNYSQDKNAYWEDAGITEEGLKIDTNTETDGRYHSNWLNMMYSRLLIARQLLREDGVFFISIDDNEAHNLRKLCDEVLGAENFIGQLVWTGGRKNDSKFISTSHEYVITYAKNIEVQKEQIGEWRLRKKGLDEIYSQYEKLKSVHKNNYSLIEIELKEWFKNLPNSNPSKAHKHYSCVDENGIYFPDNISWPGGGGPNYEVLHPKTNKPVIVPSRGWLFSDPEKMKSLIAENKVHFGSDENSVPCLKSYLKDREKQVPFSVFYQDGRASTKRLRNLMGGDYFEHPKDELILKEFFEFCTDKEDIILDFFGGSGTTGHAVMELNKEDNGNRKFILVQIPEPTQENSLAYKAGYKKISDITIDRNKRVVEAIIEEKKNQQPDLFNNGHKEDAIKGLGFKVFKLTKSNFPRVEFAPDTQKTTEENIELLKKYIRDKEAQLITAFNRDELVTEILIKNGFTLNYTLNKQKEFKKNEIFFATDGEKETLICLDISIDMETVEYFKKHNTQKFICLERALDTTKKWNLKHYLGDIFIAF